MAGLLHDLGFMVNCLAFPREFAAAMETRLPAGDSAERGGTSHHGIHALRHGTGAG